MPAGWEPPGEARKPIEVDEQSVSTLSKLTRQAVESLFPNHFRRLIVSAGVFPFRTRHAKCECEEIFMAARLEASKRKLLGMTIFYGAVTAALYGAVFANSEIVMQVFTRGGVYAALPIATVFVFSFAHGAFSGNLWSLMGIEAISNRAMKRTEVGAARPVQRPRPRLRMTA
jgi:hypothetical protein